MSKRHRKSARFPRETAEQRIARQARARKQEHDLAFSLVARQANIARSAPSTRGIPATVATTVRVSSPWKSTSRAWREANGLIPARAKRAETSRTAEILVTRALAEQALRESAGFIGDVE